MNFFPRRLDSLLPLCLLPALAGGAFGQAVLSPVAPSYEVTRATVAFTPGQAGLNLLKDSLWAARSTVDVVEFRFTHEELIDALCYLSAEKKVKVRVFLDRDSQRYTDGAEGSPDGENVPPVEPPYQSIYQKLLRNGVRVYTQKGEGTMLLRCAVIDGQTVLTGSCNWRPESFKKKYDDVLALQSPGLAQAYTDKFNSLLATSEELPAVGPSLRPDVFTFPVNHKEKQREVGDKQRSLAPTATVTKPFTVQAYFGPDPAFFKPLVNQIGQAKAGVDLAMRYLSNAQVCRSLTAAARGAVPVRVLVPQDMFEMDQGRRMQPMMAGGAKVFTSKPKLIVHWRMAVVDGRWLWTGSANATERESIDQDDLICADSPELAACYEAAYGEVITRLVPRGVP